MIQVTCLKNVHNHANIAAEPLPMDAAQRTLTLERQVGEMRGENSRESHATRTRENSTVKTSCNMVPKQSINAES